MAACYELICNLPSALFYIRHSNDSAMWNYQFQPIGVIIFLSNQTTEIQDCCGITALDVLGAPLHLINTPVHVLCFTSIYKEFCCEQLLMEPRHNRIHVANDAIDVRTSHKSWHMKVRVVSHSGRSLPKNTRQRNAQSALLENSIPGIFIFPSERSSPKY